MSRLWTTRLSTEFASAFEWILSEHFNPYHKLPNINLSVVSHPCAKTIISRGQEILGIRNSTVTTVTVCGLDSWVSAPAEFGTFVFTPRVCAPSSVLGVRQTVCCVVKQSFFHASKRDDANNSPSNLRTRGVLFSHLQSLRTECSGSDASSLVLEFYFQ